MTRPRPFPLLALLAFVAPALASCATERKPIRGFDKPPPGIVLDADPGGALEVWPIFDLPTEPQLQIFRPRLDGQDTVFVSSKEDGFYEYATWQMQGWTGGWANGLGGIPPGTYVLELVDSAGQSWGKSAPLAVPIGGGMYNSTVQSPTVVFTHFDDQAGSWTIDPATQDADTATVEITVTNLLGEDVVVERCAIAGGSRTSCTTVGTLAPQAELRTVETPVESKVDHPALFIHLARDASQAYQRDLVQGSGTWGPCQIERILVHGMRPNSIYSGTGTTAFAMSTCFGYNSGPQFF